MPVWTVGAGKEVVKRLAQFERLDVGASAALGLDTHVLLVVECGDKKFSTCFVHGVEFDDSSIVVGVDVAKLENGAAFGRKLFERWRFFREVVVVVGRCAGGHGPRLEEQGNSC